MKILFKDGDMVKEDQKLFQIDDRPAKADLAKTEAALKQANAHFERLKADFARAETLLKQEAISKQEYDTISGDRLEAEAAVGVAKANRDLAKQNLDYTTVSAPIAGRVSERKITPGNYVKMGDTLLTTIVTQDPMYVYFDIDERTTLKLQRLRDEGKIHYEKDGSVVFLFGLADEDGFPHKGVVNFFDNRLDAGTGTLRMRGEFKNDAKMTPGLFARVRLLVGPPHPALLIPERALGTDQGQKFVYVVNQNNKAKYQPIKVGALNEGMRVVETGLTGGERVVVNGLQRIRPNESVVPKPEPAPEAKGAR